MKKFIKIIIPIIIFIIIIAIILFFYIQNKKTNTTTIKNTNSIVNSKDDNYKANFNGENAVIYLGTHSQYSPFTIKLDKKLSKEELAKNIIYSISNVINYKIEINNITFKENNIYIDFSKDFAPFNLESSIIESEEKLYSVYGNDNLVYTIFDSIYKSLTTYFGSDYNIYFNCNSENINITLDNFTFYIDSSTSYLPIN